MSGKKLGKFARGEFVAWDGEGIGRGKKHEYVMLANSAGDSLTDSHGLRTYRALDLLAKGFHKHRHAIHVGFAISYDVNMMLRDLPKETLKALWNDETVDWRRGSTLYTLTYRPRKFFIVERRHHGQTMKGTLWDVWPFFQGPFVSALEKYGVADDEIRADMRRMKSRRATFRMRDLDSIALYNRDELRYLVQLMQKLHASLDSAGLVLSRWDGPGAIAAAMLEQFKFRDSISAFAPDAALDAMQHAYYGGRIECLQYGRTRATIHHYDINSAYPAAMRSLPCRSLDCGEWRFIKGGALGRITSSRFALYHVRWSFGEAPLYPFPWRSANGGVYFPPAGEGWVWTPELLAAKNVPALWRGVTVLARWEWISSCQHKEKPCEWVNRIYLERQRAHARGDGAEHALKLGLNSAYGKLAQRVGAQYDERFQHWRLPPYHDMAGAGWITSTVRAQLFQAAMYAPEQVLMLATDGIYSLVPLPLDVSTIKELGAWSYETHPGATIVQSGVYFLATDGKDYDVYSRGFDADTLDVGEIHKAWARGDASFAASHERFIGLGAALSGLSRFQLWRTWHREPRQLALHPWGTKRTPLLAPGKNRPPNPARQLVRTIATDTRRMWGDVIGNHGALTTPSAVPWRDDDGRLGVIKRMDRANAEHDDSWQ